MKKSKQAVLAYAAGILDGEGCICIVRKRISGGPNHGKIQNYFMTVVISQKDGKLMDWLVGNFGGSVYMHFKSTKTGWTHEWSLNHNKAADFLKSLLPFLVLKKRQAEIAIRYQTRIKAGVKLTEHELETKRLIAEELRAQKGVYTFSKQPNVQKRLTDATKSMVQL